MPFRCPHTDLPLKTDSRTGSSFARSPRTGAVYFLEAKHLAYGADYFLDEYKKQYGKSYHEDEENLRRLARRRLRLLEKSGVRSGRLLEIGCAAGFFLDEARAAGFETAGVEISPYASRFAREQLGLQVETAPFFDAKLEGPYDVVAAFYVLEHFDDQRRFFSRVGELLRPGGVFLFAAPSTFGPLYRCHPEEWVRSHPRDHFADYSPGSLRRIFPLYGMSLDRVRPASHHPERACGLFSSRIIRPFYGLAADLLGYGDTMEGAARRVGRE